MCCESLLMQCLSFNLTLFKKKKVIFILNGFIWKILSPTYYSCIASSDDFMLLNTSVNILWHQSLNIQPLQDELQMPWEDPLEERGGSWKNISSSTTWVCLNRDHRGCGARKVTRIIQSFLWLRTGHDVLDNGPFPTLCCRCSAVTTHSKSNFVGLFFLTNQGSGLFFLLVVL